MPSRRRGPVTAGELMAELENDPDYRSRVARATAERRAAHEAMTLAERPLVAELRAAGIAVDSVWDLHRSPAFAEAAYPILVKHIVLEYPDRVLEGIARAFDTAVVRRHWSRLVEIYASDIRGEAQNALAAALSGSAVRRHYDDLVAIVENESLGSSRIFFLRPINRIGNRMTAGAGRQVVESFASHTTLGVEATAILRGRSPSD